MWSTNFEKISSRRNRFGLGPYFCEQIKHIPLKKVIIRTTCKAVNCFSNVARVKYSIVTSFYFYYVCKICTDITPTNSHTKWGDRMKAWNYITTDFDQEMGQEYSKIVQIIVKADRGKAIVWRSLSCKMTCYYILNILYLVFILYPVCSLLSAFCTNRYPWHQYSLFLVSYLHNTHNLPQNTCVSVNSTFSSLLF